MQEKLRDFGPKQPANPWTCDSHSKTGLCAMNAIISASLTATPRTKVELPLPRTTMKMNTDQSDFLWPTSFIFYAYQLYTLYSIHCYRRVTLFPILFIASCGLSVYQLIALLSAGRGFHCFVNRRVNQLVTLFFASYSVLLTGTSMHYFVDRRDALLTVALVCAAIFIVIGELNNYYSIHCSVICEMCGSLSYDRRAALSTGALNN